MERVSADMTDRWPAAVYHCDQPHGDASFMPYHRVSELAVRHVTMVLTGDGGDELFGGYEKFTSFFGREGSLSSSEAAFQRTYHDHISLFTEQGKAGIYTPGFAGKVAGADSFAFSKGHLEAASHLDRVNQALYLDCMLLLPGNNLVKPDRMPMAASLEARNPFMDVRMAELAFRIPGAVKMRGNVTRHLYKEAVRGVIGDELTFRKKQMFTVPIGEWFKDRLRGFTERVLLSETCLGRGIFSREALQTMLAEHQSGAANHTRELRVLIALELWFRTFLDRQDLSAPTLAELGAPIAP
jgi:asparagine synthase (glutamine-hydrolysing)